MQRYINSSHSIMLGAEIAQLGERKTEDLKVAGSIPAFGMFLYFYCEE